MPLCHECRSGAEYTVHGFGGRQIGDHTTHPPDPEGLSPGEACDRCGRLNVAPAKDAEGKVRIEQATTRRKNAGLPTVHPEGELLGGTGWATFALVLLLVLAGTSAGVLLGVAL